MESLHFAITKLQCMSCSWLTTFRQEYSDIPLKLVSAKWWRSGCVTAPKLSGCKHRSIWSADSAGSSFWQLLYSCCSSPGISLSQLNWVVYLLWYVFPTSVYGDRRPNGSDIWATVDNIPFLVAGFCSTLEVNVSRSVASVYSRTRVWCVESLNRCSTAGVHTEPVFHPSDACWLRQT